MGFQSRKKRNLSRQAKEAVLPDPLSSLLCLIAATILADKRGGVPDGKTFIRQIGGLGLLPKMGFKISDVCLFYWYEHNKEIIRDNLQGPYFKIWYFRLLDQLSTISDKQLILEVMRASTADKRAHANGRALLTLTRHYWQEP